MIKKLLFILLVVMVSAITAYSVSNTGGGTATQDGLDRVLQTQTLRCGFVDYEPANFRDPQSNELKGILTDVANHMGAQLGLKIEWVQSSGWATFVADLEAGKYDAFCGAAWILKREPLVADATMPIYFSAISAWVRHDETRFNETLSNVNDPAITIAATDGSMPALLAEQLFPKAKVLSLPETAAYSMNLLNVANGKADIGFLEQYIGYQYAAANPSSVKNITANKPIRVAQNVFEVKKGDVRLLSMLNMMLSVMHDNGEIDAIIRKYEPAPNTFLRRTPSYSQPSYTQPSHILP